MNRYLRSLQSELKEDLRQLIAIKTVYDKKSISGHAPFGKGIREGFDFILERAIEEGLDVKDVEGYGMHVEYGEGDELVGLLCHMDTVGVYEPDQWLSEPFALLEKDGIWYGRGVNDNKGPLMGCLYLLIALKRLGVRTSKRIRLIIGGAEETTWEGIRKYFLFEEMPSVGISPDGNFPIVHCEKGIRFYTVTGHEISKTVEWIRSKRDRSMVCDHIEVMMSNAPESLKFSGQRAPSRHPDRGINAISKMAGEMEGMMHLEIISCIREHFDRPWNEAGITCNLSSLNYEGDTWSLEFDVRWSRGYDEKMIDERVRNIFGDLGDIHVSDKSKPLHYVEPNDPLITQLKEAYHDVIGEEAGLLVKGGASYARALKKGVAFGPCFEGEESNAHQPNEQQSIESLFRALETYLVFLEKCEAIYEA